LQVSRKKELFSVLQEECGEVVQAVSKITRFGEDSCNPKDRKKITNIKKLESELGDILGVLKLLIEEGHVDGENIMKCAENKIKKLEEFMQHKM